MSQTASLSWTRAQAAERDQLYRRILGINLAITALIGLVALVAPFWLASLFGQPTPFPPVWVRLWGLLLLFLCALYVPGWLRPTQVRMPNLIGIVERIVLGIAYLLAGTGFLVLGLYSLIFAVLLGITYYRLFQAELATRP